MVSIILCTYNGDKYLEEQLASLSAQTYPVIEFICSDNGSTDNTVPILQDWCAKAPNRKLYHCKEKGLNKNFYHAISYASGDFIFFSDQDDVWLPQKVDRLVSFHQANPGVSMVYCLSNKFSGKPDTSNTSHSMQHPLEGCNIRKTMLTSFTLGHNLCIKKNVLEKLPVPPNEVIAFDWWITVAAMCTGPVKCLAEVLTFWRQHQSNTSTELNKGLYYESRILYLQTFLQNHLISGQDAAWIKEAISKFKTLQHQSFSPALCWFLFTNGDTIFFYKKKTNVILKRISFLKWAIRISRQSYRL